MVDRSEPFTLGIEEEYLLVDPATGELVSDGRLQEAVIARVQDRIDESIGMVTQEFLMAQVEVGTAICTSISDARAKLSHLRRSVIEAAAEEGLAPIAASTHPTADWKKLPHTEKERYNTIAHDLQAVARRMVISGMHVHVGIERDDDRMDLLGQLAYFLPHLLALTTSSPFWQGRNSGLRCYRLAVFDELPRTGLPERFDSWAEYKRHLDVMVSAGVIPDGSKIWWDIRPHFKFPTLEMRIADICTRMEDGLTVAALFACLTRMLQRLRRSNQRWRNYSNMLIQENRWRAQRHGFDAGLVDFGTQEIVPYMDLLEELISLSMPDAEELGCVEEVEHAREIVRRGTSSHRQVEVYERTLAGGATEAEALKAVVDWLIAETQMGI